jgi:hypothetical protein
LSTSQAFPNPSHFCPSRCTSCVEMLNVHGQTPADNHSRRSNTVQGTSDGGDTQKHIRPIGRGHSSYWNNFRWVTLTGPISSRSKPGTGSNRQMLQSSPTRNIWKGNDMHSTFPAHVMPQLEVDSDNGALSQASGRQPVQGSTGWSYKRSHRGGFPGRYPRSRARGRGATL